MKHTSVCTVNIQTHICEHLQPPLILCPWSSGFSLFWNSCLCTLKIIFLAVYGYMSTIYKQYITQSLDLVSRRVMFPVAMQSFFGRL